MKYTAQTHHTIDYNWVIDAPKELTEEEVKLVLQELLYFRPDDPNTKALMDLLDNIDFCDLDHAKIHLYRQIVLHPQAITNEGVITNFRYLQLNRA